MSANIKANDLELFWVDPTTDFDRRVPTARELTASSHLQQQNLKKSQQIERPAGLRNRPAFTAAATRGVTLPAGLSPYAPGHPSLAALTASVTVNLPALADTVSSVSRYDHVYLLVFSGIVTATIDPDLLLTYGWRNNAGTIQSLTGENTRRRRTFWAIAISQGETNLTNIWNALGTNASGAKVITGSTAIAGAALNATHQIYAIDSNLVNNQQYEVAQDGLELIPLLRVWRVQNFTQNGFVWGRGGEVTTFTADFHLQPTYRYVGEGWDQWEVRATETFRRVQLGLPLMNTPGLDRSVQNLLNGQVAGNLDAPGVATASPNGSTAIANGQRVGFSNQGGVQRGYCLPVVTDNAGGFARATVPFQVNSPSGSYFSTAIADHQVFSINGRNITGDGTITGLGGTGALVWTANSSIIAPGDTVFFVAGIYYPPGSGFAVTGQIESVFLNAVAVNAANVREASAGQNVTAYVAPAAGESYIVVLGRERAALHYIYRRITVSSNAQGIVTIPTTERGTIAYISGTNAPTGRIDAPVVTGLVASTTYNLLIYYPPRPTENWQFQFRTARYAGSGDRDWVNGAQIAAAPITLAHTQGGGNNVFLSDGELQFEAIAFRLPANTLSAAIKHFSCNHKVQFVFEAGDVGATSIRPDVPLMPATGLALPKVGQVLSVVNGTGVQSRGFSARLEVSGRVLGVMKLPIQCSQSYQLAIALLLQKGDDRRLLIVTTNEGNTAIASAVRFDSDSPHFAAMDLFTIF